MRHRLTIRSDGSLKDGRVSEALDVRLSVPFRCGQSGRSLKGCHEQVAVLLLAVHPVRECTARISFVFSTGATYVVLRHNSVELYGG